MTNKTDRQVSVRAVRRALLRWYDGNRRRLPWRRTRDPYAIWVSEIMLQQTQVATVVPYFERFMAAFPTVKSLASARLDDVLKRWEGLGYYSRARNLHRAARKVADEFGGELPGDVEGLRTLPGIGRYTAGAVASIAFGLDEPVLDGNVSRVLCRVYCVEGDPKSAPVSARLWELARDLLPHERPGDFNQALMELGAIVCMPKNPACPECPVRRQCLAYRTGAVDRYPEKTKRKPTPHVDVAVGVVYKRGRVLIDKRPTDAMLGGLWEFPGGKPERGETLEDCVRREIAEELGVDVEVGEKLATVRHAYSHFRITLHAYRCRWTSGEARPIECDDIKWVWPSALRDYAFPRATYKVIEALER